MAGYTNENGEPLAIQVNVTRSFAEGNGATLVTTVPQTGAQEGINHVIDTLMATMERMEIHARISALNNDLEANAQKKAQIEFSLADLRRRHPDPDKMNTPDRTSLQTTEDTLLRIELLTKSLVEEQKRLREVLK